MGFRLLYLAVFVEITFIRYPDILNNLNIIGIIPVSGQNLIILGYDAKAPKYYVEDGTPKVILIDMVKRIGKEIGYNFDIRLYPWKRAYIAAITIMVFINNNT